MRINECEVKLRVEIRSLGADEAEKERSAKNDPCWCRERNNIYYSAYLFTIHRRRCGPSLTGTICAEGEPIGTDCGLLSHPYGEEQHSAARVPNNKGHWSRGEEEPPFRPPQRRCAITLKHKMETGEVETAQPSPGGPAPSKSQQSRPAQSTAGQLWGGGRRGVAPGQYFPMPCLLATARGLHGATLRGSFLRPVCIGNGTIIQHVYGPGG